MADLVELIREANPKRKKKNLDRRIMKLGEEYGEVVQAYLAITSKNNLKGKSWDDVREELCDVIIVALDVILTEFPDEKFSNSTKDQDIEARTFKEIQRKLAKWHAKMDSSQAKTDDSE